MMSLISFHDMQNWHILQWNVDVCIIVNVALHVHLDGE